MTTTLDDLPARTTAASANGAAHGAAHGDMLDRVQQLRLDGQLGAAKDARPRNAPWLPWMLAAALALAWAGMGLRTYRPPGSDGNFAAAPTGSPAGSAASAASSSAPVVAPGAVLMAVTGYIVPAVSVAVSPIDAAGQVIELNFKEGQFYEAGTPLARIDPTNYQYAANEAGEGVASAGERLNAAIKRRDELDPKSVRQIEKDQLKAQINEATALKARSDDELRRMETIRGSVSAKEFDTANNDAIAAKFRLQKLDIDLRILEVGPRPERIAAADADVAVARSEVKSAEAKLAQAMWRVRNCVIRAPISGTITAKVAEKGVLVNPLAFSAAAGSGGIGTIADLADMEADLEIAEREIAQLAVGMACSVKVNAYPNRAYTGVIDRILPQANRAKSVVSIRVKIALLPGEKPGAYLKPEMGAVVTFRAAEAKAP